MIKTAAVATHGVQAQRGSHAPAH
ncbi:MAG: hypothetical protein QOE54_3201, partial [Streptosporangiaceae bacterium]|nr:hypothetical protein [Streptosporangiaceae bacterium]